MLGCGAKKKQPTKAFCWKDILGNAGRELLLENTMRPLAKQKVLA